MSATDQVVPAEDRRAPATPLDHLTPVEAVAGTVVHLGPPLAVARLAVTGSLGVYGPRHQPVLRDTGGCGTYPWGTWRVTNEHTFRLELLPARREAVRVRWSVGGRALVASSPAGASGAETYAVAAPLGPTADVVVDWATGEPTSLVLRAVSVDAFHRSLPVAAEVEASWGTIRVSSTLQIEGDLHGFLPDDALKVVRCRSLRRPIPPAPHGGTVHDGALSPAGMAAVRQVGSSFAAELLGREAANGD